MNTAQVLDRLPSFLIPFVTLSYPVDRPAVPDSFNDSSYYASGLLDFCAMVSMIAVMAVLRDAFRLGVFEPLAKWYLTRQLKLNKAKAKKHANGNGKANGATNGHAVHDHPPAITKKEAKQLKRSVIRFAEQGWPVVYYSLQWCFGLYVHRNLPTKVLDPVDVWTNYPHIPLAGPIKLYYLTQNAFYMHQILVLNAEARRKDHWQMMTHHVITVVLMLGSYFYNFTRIGVLIMMLMDLCDIFLPLAKMWRYLGFSKACDATFVMFMGSWLVTRHFLFLLAIKSSYNDAPRIIPEVWEPERGFFMTKEVLATFNAMLVSLQIIQLIWFWMVCRVAWRVVSGQGAEDSRSDDEM
ncbi:longevity assurance proteins LAG1/LAC1 [Irpex rosettiformis]|uniref:Longevity assurance proteins LAG1/LAC1 n=1 Tax=Irpex rosettiformis TaxID=378272 RepID=A0ACB8U482_9APHY|nr:longevity assurance proteins LAG1/LAC1 [Irpex rosettiformis]